MIRYSSPARRVSPSASLATDHHRGWARSRTVYQRYKELAEFQGRDFRTACWMRSFLSNFEILNLTLSHKEHRSQGGDTCREHELNRDIATVVDALQTIISEFGAHWSIVEYLPDSGEGFPTM